MCVCLPRSRILCERGGLAACSRVRKETGSLTGLTGVHPRRAQTGQATANRKKRAKCCRTESPLRYFQRVDKASCARTLEICVLSGILSCLAPLSSPSCAWRGYCPKRSLLFVQGSILGFFVLIRSIILLHGTFFFLNCFCGCIPCSKPQFGVGQHADCSLALCFQIERSRLGYTDAESTSRVFWGALFDRRTA